MSQLLRQIDELNKSTSPHLTTTAKWSDKAFFEKVLALREAYARIHWRNLGTSLLKDRGTMDSCQKMDIGNWQDSPLPTVPKARAQRRYLPPTLLGVVGTGLLHAMLIQSISVATRGPRPKPPERQELTNTPSKTAAETENLSLISLPTISNSSGTPKESAISSLPDLRKMKVKPQIDIDSPATLNLETLTEDQPARAKAGGAEGTELVRLFGIYTGQIQARIDRVWRRPRTPVSEDTASDVSDSFQCEAQIFQDLLGNVQEILLPRCNGSPAWQHSLVLAIQQASPLPAPPSDKVFSRSITLNFLGLTYLAGALEDDYEPRRTLVGAQ